MKKLTTRNKTKKVALTVTALKRVTGGKFYSAKRFMVANVGHNSPVSALDLAHPLQ